MNVNLDREVCGSKQFSFKLFQPFAYLCKMDNITMCVLTNTKKETCSGSHIKKETSATKDEQWFRPV